MKKVGKVDGIAPASTLDYYVALLMDLEKKDNNYPEIVINCIQYNSNTY